MKYPSYTAYKPSNIDWIGDIPKDWEVRKVSHSFDLIGSGTTPKSDDESLYIDGDVSWLITGDLNDRIITETSKKITLKGFRKYSTLKKYPIGSLVIAMYGATIGKLGFMNIEACTNQACCVLGKSKVFDMKYVFYWFLSSKKHIIFLSYGGGQPNISKDTISTLKIITPPLQTQQKISNYLDTQTTQIDTLISKDEKLIELLKQKRVSFINEVVTKGLDKNVEMKDSGVEWIGKIPKDWEVRKVKNVTNYSIGGTPPSGDEKNFGGNSIWITIGDMENWEYLTNSKTKLSDYGIKKFNIKKVKKDSLLYSFKLSVGTISIAGCDLYTNEAIISFSDSKYFDKMFFGYSIKSYLSENSNRNIYGAKIMNQNIIQNSSVLLPPIQTQQKISNFLDKETQKIDTTISKIEKRIELYKERKQSLIHHTVTGKIMV